MARTCARCDEPLADDARFCDACGASVPPRVQEEAGNPVTGTIHSLGVGPSDTGPVPTVASPELQSLPAGTQALVVVRGPNTGTQIDLTGDEMVVGRSPDTAIFLDDITVSRQHAKFVKTDSQWALHDLGSLNGTYVNKNRIEVVDLNQGDEIQIGKYRFRYMSGGNA